MEDTAYLLMLVALVANESTDQHRHAATATLTLLSCVTITTRRTGRTEKVVHNSVGNNRAGSMGKRSRADNSTVGNRNSRVDSNDDSSGDGGNNRCSEL